MNQYNGVLSIENTNIFLVVYPDMKFRNKNFVCNTHQFAQYANFSQITSMNVSFDTPELVYPIPEHIFDEEVYLVFNYRNGYFDIKDKNTRSILSGVTDLDFLIEFYQSLTPDPQSCEIFNRIVHSEYLEDFPLPKDIMEMSKRLYNERMTLEQFLKTDPDTMRFLMPIQKTWYKDTLKEFVYYLQENLNEKEYTDMVGTEIRNKYGTSSS